MREFVCVYVANRGVCVCMCVKDRKDESKRQIKDL